MIKMMKSCLLITLLAVGLTACGGGDDSPSNFSNNDQNQQNDINDGDNLQDSPQDNNNAPIDDEDNITDDENNPDEVVDDEDLNTGDDIVVDQLLNNDDDIVEDPNKGNNDPADHPLPSDDDDPVIEDPIVEEPIEEPIEEPVVDPLESLVSIEIFPKTLRMNSSSLQQAVAVGTTEDGLKHPLTHLVDWDVDDASAASVSSTGEITVSNKTATTRLKASYKNVSGNYDLEPKAGESPEQFTIFFKKPDLFESAMMYIYVNEGESEPLGTWPGSPTMAINQPT